MKIDVSEGKTLKLTNVLSLHLTFEEFRKGSVDKKVKLFHSHILNKGGKPKGPLINHNRHPRDGMRRISFLQQVHERFPTHPPYTFDEEIIVKNCLYTRFEGKSYDVDFAYQKLNLYAFEEEITVADESYSVFLKGDPNQGEKVVVDIFLPVKALQVI
jgi:hypothetical protein